jgi:propanol-preferring alcohol dehydrogenase
MRAMILTQQKRVEELPLTQREMDAPRAGPGEVRVKVSVCAVCRTDLHIIEGDLAPHRMPVIPGHQIVGRVDETGDGVMRLRVGRRIGIAWLQHVDGTCQFCRRGRENLCCDSRYTGYDVDGGYAEYAVVPEDFAYALPEDLDDEHVSPLLCAGLIGYRALQRATVPEKGRLLLVGFGSSAHIVIQARCTAGMRYGLSPAARITCGRSHERCAFYGAEAIPESWLERLAMRDFIREMADALFNLSQAAS